MTGQLTATAATPIPPAPPPPPHLARTGQRELGRELRAARLAARYSRAQLGRATAYSRSTVSTVESGSQKPPRAFWASCDHALKTGGTLLAGYDRLARERTTGTLNGVLAGLARVADQVPVPADRVETVARMLEELSAELASAATMLRSHTAARPSRPRAPQQYP